MSVFLLLKKKTYCNPPSFKERFRRWYLDNSEKGRNSQIPWYTHVNFILILTMPVISFLLFFYGIPIILS